MSIEFTSALSQSIRCGLVIPSLNNVGGSTQTAWVVVKSLPNTKYSIVASSVGPPPGTSPDSRAEIEVVNDPGAGDLAQYKIVSRSLDGDADSIDGTPDGTVKVNFRQFVAATIDFTTRQVKFYVDGVLVNTGIANSMTAGNTSATNGKCMAIGSEDDGTSNEFIDAFVEDVRQYNRVLSANEIMTMYECQGVDGIVFGLQQRYELQSGAAGQNVSEISPSDTAQQQLNASVISASSPVYRDSIAPTFRRRLP